MIPKVDSLLPILFISRYQKSSRNLEHIYLFLEKNVRFVDDFLKWSSTSTNIDNYIIKNFESIEEKKIVWYQN